MSLRATATLNRRDGTTVTVELHQVGYTGSAVVAALRTLNVRWQTDDPLAPFLPSSASVGLLITDDQLISALTGAYPEDREWKIRLLTDSLMMWEGWVLPDQIVWSMDLTRGKIFDLEATDGLALLDKEPVGSRTGFVRIADFLTECFNVIGLGTEWALWNDYMMSGFSAHYDLADVEVRWDRYADLSLKEMLADVLGRFALRMWRQAMWLVGGSRRESHTWAHFSGGTRTGSVVIPSSISGWQSNVLSGSQVRRMVPVRRVVVRYKAGQLVSSPSSLISNGGFTWWPDPSQPPTDWTWTAQMDRLGDIDGGSGYSVGLPVALIPDSSAPPDTSGPYIEQQSPTTLAAGTGHLKLSLRTNLIATGGTIPSDPSDRPIAVVIKVGSYYWDGAQQQWTTSFAYVTVKAGFGTEQHIIETGLLPDTAAPLVRVYSVSDWNGDVSGCYLDDVVLEFVASGDEYVVEEQADAANQNSETIEREYRIGDGPSLDWSGAMRYGGTVTGPWTVSTYSGSIDYVRANDELELRSPAMLMYDVDIYGDFLPWNVFQTDAGLSRVLELENDMALVRIRLKMMEWPV